MPKHSNGDKGGEISTIPNPCVYSIIATFMQILIVSMTLCRKPFSQSNNIDLSLIMIDRQHQLFVYVMAGMAQCLIFKLVGIRRSRNPDSHCKLMMRMMKMIVYRISTVSISKSNRMYPRSYLVTAHIPPSTQLIVTIKKSNPDEKTSEEKLLHLLYSIAHFSALEVIISDKDIKVLLSFNHSAEDARRANMYLKILEVPIIAANGKQFMRKVEVKYVKPKKSGKVHDQEEILLLDPFEYLPVYSRPRKSGPLIWSRPIKWLKPLIIFVINRYGVRDCTHMDLVRLPVYINSKCRETSQIRIPHPDHPTIKRDILDMMKCDYIREGEIIVPREILDMCQCWDV